ncbi:carbohydrate ABC transporter permease [Nocardioides sp. zg-1308]|jgi:multiple sugar transport system permease protein|uniref:Carbohydrate ABC transporter permease n=1 Tax=Nocardioides renjunii TaxID=3095075 RepID=A0ABU5K8S5_9ACTN|nr:MULTISPECIES: carbohydrate ABC transporter permease [unclassified Nocardioides]MDZ5661363.1 carbohydrate ABC transporter permease [Nocardioides sp. S-58]NPD04474.1 carbohydrate ABC transporter permease [Nocardioides sp. zg-1308]
MSTLDRAGEAGPTTGVPPVDPDEAVTAPARAPQPPNRRPGLGGRIFVAVALVVTTIAFVYPFVWLVSASLKPRSDVFDNRLIPETLTFDNYIEVWNAAPMAAWLLNTAFVTIMATLTVTISSALVAWGFARYQFRGRNFLFGLVLASMMIPGAATMIPTYLIWDSLGMVGTLTPLWAGNVFGTAFYIFLLRQFFLGLPTELFDAAEMDGAGHWKVFWHVALPLTKPALVVVALFEFQAAWTDLMRGLIYLRDREDFTVPRGLKSMLDQFGFGGEWHWELVVTASVITTVPMILVFFLGQKQIIQGVASTGTKG